MSLRRLQQRPEQPRQSHGREIFQRKPIKESIVGQFEKVAGARAARIVDEDIAAPETFRHAREDLLALLDVAQIARDNKRLRAQLGNLFGSRRQFVRRRRSKNTLRAFARERRSDTTAYAAAAAGDDHDLSLEFSRHGSLLIRIRLVASSLDISVKGRRLPDQSA